MVYRIVSALAAWIRSIFAGPKPPPPKAPPRKPQAGPPPTEPR